jgi:hypothetical protein
VLTVSHPELLPYVRDWPIGLRAFHLGGNEPAILVVKGLKEAILAVRMNRSFAVYIAPVVIDGVASIALITAFFDDQDEPLVVRSPLFANDGHSKALLYLLLAPKAHVHFFDEHARELLAYQCTVSMTPATRIRLRQAAFVAYGDDKWRGIDDQVVAWFSTRSEQDDEAAVRIDLDAPLMPEDVALIDLSGDSSAYLGAAPVSETFLVRSEPGPLQEHDIALLLRRVFAPAQIIKGALRTTDREEIADLLVVTDRTLIFIQAKDSPNTGAVLANTIARKKATAIKSLTKALAQLRGAIRYARRRPIFSLIAEGRQVDLDVAGHRWIAIAVVKELFNNEYDRYSPMVLDAASDIGVPCIALDYAELNMYTANLADETSMLVAIDRVYDFTRLNGTLPRLRIGPGTPEEAGGEP